MYKVKHIPTGLYYQPVTSSGTNLGKKGKIYETSSSCLSGSENYIIIDIKKESPVYRDFAGILESTYGLHKSGAKFGCVYCKITKSDFEKEYLPIDINTLKTIFDKQKKKYYDSIHVKQCLDEILEQITCDKIKHEKDKEPNLDEFIKAVRENVESTNRTKEFLQKINEFLK